MSDQGVFKELAEQMWQYARENPRLNTVEPIAPYQRMFGELRLALFMTVSQRVVLSASRLGKWASSKELAAIKRDFEIPNEAKEERREAGQFYVVRFSWQHSEQMKVFEVGPVAGNVVLREGEA